MRFDARSSAGIGASSGWVENSIARCRVLFVDDDEAFLSALDLVFEGRAVEVLKATCVSDALAIAAPPDAAFIELGLPDGDGVDLVRRFVARWPEVPVVVLTVSKAGRRVLDAFRAGAQGYLFKEDVGSGLESALREALAGGAPMSRAVARMVLDALSALPGPSGHPRATDPSLTSRELDVVRLLADGCTYDQVAHALGVSVNTVRAHVRRIYEKLAVGNRTEAVLAAIRLGLLPPV